MANRKKKGLNIRYNLSDINKIMTEEYGGDIAIIGEEKNLDIIKKYVPQKENIKIFKIVNIENNIIDNIDDTFGMIMIFAKDVLINDIMSRIDNQNVTIVVVTEDFYDLTYLNDNIYYYFVIENIVSRQMVEQAYIKANIKKCISFIDDIFCKKDSEIIKIKNINMEEDFNKLVVDTIENDKENIESNTYNKLNKLESKYSLKFFQIWLYFALNYIVGANLTSEINMLVLKSTINSINRDISNYYLKNDALLNNFNKKYTKQMLMIIYRKIIDIILSDMEEKYLNIVK